MPERIGSIHILSFLSVAALASALFAVALLPGFRTWEVVANSVVIARNAASVPARDIVGNLVAFSGTDAYRQVFFARIGRSDLVSSRAGEDLGKSVIVERASRGSMLSIRGRASDPERAERIAREAALSLFSFAGRYYDIRTEADFRIVGMSPARRVVAEPIAYAGVSLSLGFGTAAALFLLFSFVPAIRERFRVRISEAPVLGSEVFLPKRPQVPEAWGSGHTDGEEAARMIPEEKIAEAFAENESDARKDILEQEAVSPETEATPTFMAESVGEAYASEESERLGKIPENLPVAMPETAPRVSGKKAVAPGNLPTAMTEAEARFLNEFSFEERTDEEDAAGSDEAPEEPSPEEPERFLESSAEPEQERNVSEESAPSEIFVPEEAEPELPTEPTEPTQEEYRRRLNELLRG